jgi:hypothetical protein
MKKSLSVFVLFLALLLVWGCGQPPRQPLDPTLQQPQVLYLMPDNRWKVSPEDNFYVQFSETIDPTTVTEETVFLLPEEVSLQAFDNGRDFEKTMQDKWETYHTVMFQWVDEAHTGLLLTPTESLLEKQRYTVVVTTGVMTPDQFPLNQMPGSAPVPYFKVYEVGEKPQPSSIPLDNPDLVIPLEDSGDDEVSDEFTTTASIPKPESLLNRIWINEIFYDAVGSEGDGQLFIELKGEPGLNVSGIQVVLINGSDGKETDSIEVNAGYQVRDNGFFVIADTRTGSETETQVAHYDFLDNFDPQNGPDCIQLFDGTGARIDAVAYGTGGVDCGSLAIYEDASAGQSLSRSSEQQGFVINLTPSPGTDLVTAE